MPIVSFSYELRENNTAELMQMIVLPKYQRKGVGKYTTNKFLALTRGREEQLRQLLILKIVQQLLFTLRMVFVFMSGEITPMGMDNQDYNLN